MKMSITPETIPENVYFNKNHLLSAAATRPLSSIMGGVGADNVSLADAQLVSRFINAGIQRHHPRLPHTHRHTHTVHALNTVLFPLRADSSTLGSGAVPSQQSKVCSDGDQTEAAAASRWKRRRRQSSTETGKENWERSDSERLESQTD